MPLMLSSHPLRFQGLSIHAPFPETYLFKLTSQTSSPSVGDEASFNDSWGGKDRVEWESPKVSRLTQAMDQGLAPTDEEVKEAMQEAVQLSPLGASMKAKLQQILAMPFATSKNHETVYTKKIEVWGPGEFIYNPDNGQLVSGNQIVNDQWTPMPVSAFPAARQVFNPQKILNDRDPNNISERPFNPSKDKVFAEFMYRPVIVKLLATIDAQNPDEARDAIWAEGDANHETKRPQEWIDAISAGAMAKPIS